MLILQLSCPINVKKMKVVGRAIRIVNIIIDILSSSIIGWEICKVFNYKYDFVYFSILVLSVFLQVLSSCNIMWIDIYNCTFLRYWPFYIYEVLLSLVILFVLFLRFKKLIYNSVKTFIYKIYIATILSFCLPSFFFNWGNIGL